MPTTWQRVTICVAAALAACSVKPATFMVGDGQPADASQPGDAQLGDAQSSDAAPPQFLSCASLPMTCGASGNDSCCNSPKVLGGTYFRSYDAAGDSAAGNTMYPATVSNFRLDKYEVTVGRFRAFVNAGMGTQASPPLPGAGAHANIAGSGWDASWNASLVADKAALIAAIKCSPEVQTWTDSPGANENLPMNCISWYEAMAFCTWDGGYLATEAEWNYAATGGDEQRAYPWYTPAGALSVNYSYASYSDTTDCVGDGVPGCSLTDVTPVGSKPMGTGRWGHADLAGNVWEWTLDWYANYATPCTNCADLTPASYRLVRGGSFYFDARFLRTGVRDAFPPDYRYIYIGFRCARSAP